VACNRADAGEARISNLAVFDHLHRIFAHTNDTIGGDTNKLFPSSFASQDKKILRAGHFQDMVMRRCQTMQTTPTAHIHLDERGVAWIDDTNTKVVEVVLDKLAHGSSPEEIHFQHAHLSLAQIHAALSYYYDHQQAIDAYIEQQHKWVEAMATQAGDSPVRQRLRALGKLP
jgi:uncharacterized protein (DUF433 family)